MSEVVSGYRRRICLRPSGRGFSVGRKTLWKEDTGRGFLSFIIVFVSSYMCFLFSRFLPETPEVIYGAKGALEVYGSMHNILLGLCAAGAISCLIRRYYRP